MTVQPAEAAWRAQVEAAGRGVLAGVLAGILVPGFGSRLVMKVVALVAGPSAEGMVTENGNVIGAFTLDGTLGLVIFAGATTGAFGGLFYAVVRPQLGRGPVQAGLMFGLVALAGLGSTVISPENSDFARFGSPVANIILFAALFPLFGLTVGLISARLDQSSGFLRSGAGRALLYVLLIGPCIPLLLGMAALLAEERLAQFAIVAMLLALPLAPKLPTGGKSLGYALLGGAVVLGLFLDVSAVLKILRTASMNAV